MASSVYVKSDGASVLHGRDHQEASPRVPLAPIGHLKMPAAVCGNPGGQAATTLTRDAIAISKRAVNTNQYDIATSPFPSGCHLRHLVIGLWRMALLANLRRLPVIS